MPELPVEPEGQFTPPSRSGWSVAAGNVPRRARRIRWLCELLFSLHGGWLLANTRVIAFGKLSVLLGVLLGPFFRHRIDPTHPRDAATLGLAEWLVLGAMIFICLRLGGRLQLVGRLPVHVAGLGSVVGLPLLLLLTADLWGGSVVAARLSPPVVPWLWMETAAVVACAVLYVRRWPWANAAWGVLLVVMHFALWGWVAWHCWFFGMLCLVWDLLDRPWRLIENGLFVLLPACASFAWALYVRTSARATRARSTAPVPTSGG